MSNPVKKSANIWEQNVGDSMRQWTINKQDAILLVCSMQKNCQHSKIDTILYCAETVKISGESKLKMTFVASVESLTASN